MKALIDAPRPLPALRLARRLERFLSADRDGLLFTLPLRAHADAVWNAGKPRLLLPSTQSVDAAGTYFDPRTDLITSALANRLRIGGIDQATKKQGALFEGARTNTCLQSEAFDNASWAKNQSTIAADDTTAPDSNLTADKLVEDSQTGFHLVRQSISVTSGQKIVISVFAKKGERTEINLRGDGTAGPANATVWFDLNAGTKGTVGADVNDSGMDDMGDGWYRCWLVFTADASDVFTMTSIIGGPGSENESYAGDGSSGLYLWGAQCEQNVEYPTSYSKTTTASVTRAADDFRFSNAAQANIKTSAGTIYIACTPEADLVTSVIWDADSGADGTELLVEAGVYRFFYRGEADITGTTAPVRGVTNVVAVTWKTNDFRLYVDGSEEASDTAGTPGTMHTTLFVGINHIASRWFAGNLAHLHSYDSAHDAARVLQNTREIQAWLGI